MIRPDLNPSASDRHRRVAGDLRDNQQLATDIASAAQHRSPTTKSWEEIQRPFAVNGRSRKQPRYGDRQILITRTGSFRDVLVSFWRYQKKPGATYGRTSSTALLASSQPDQGPNSVGPPPWIRRLFLNSSIRILELLEPIEAASKSRRSGLQVT